MAANVIAFRNATVLSCTGAEPAEATVIVEDGVIADIVGTASPVPAAADSVECRGRTLMPGLIDAHVHICALDVDLARQRRQYPPSLVAYEAAANAERTLRQGFTTVRDAGGADWGMKEAVRRGLVAGPRMLVSGHPLSQTGGHGDARSRAETGLGCACGTRVGMGSVIADGADEVRRAAREQLRQGADQIKVMASGGVASPTDPLDSPQYTVEELRAAVEVASAAGSYVLAHAYTPAAIRNAVEAGVRSIEHGNFLDEPTARLMAERGTFLVPTFVTYEKLYEEGRELGFPQVSLDKLDAVLGAGLDGLQRAKDAGVRIGSGSDLLGPLARHKVRELTIKSRVLGEHAALQATTRMNAELLGISAQTGTVEPGKEADLLLVDGDPLSNIGVLEDPERLVVIMRAGEFVVRAA